MYQSYRMFLLHHYTLQPGDGTIYRLGLIPDLSEAEVKNAWESTPTGGHIRGNAVQTVGEPDEPHMGYDISGIGDGSAYARVFFFMESTNGFVDLRRDELENPQGYLAGYIRGKLGGGNDYSIMAILLAASVLMRDPTDINRALKAMLRVPELLFPNKED